ncbi:MAG TPA: tetratricopeptide repeat protein, partial [Candidatus Binatia bacterium]|nr:tetratricopeptide repeat protein [Candidatus Binatia bacterium]
MATSRWALAVLVACLATVVCAQNTGKAVRHHKIAEADPMFPPELTQAEDAIEKKNYATAQTLLEKVVAANPANYQAWFDLGFVHNAQGKTDESIAAYRKSVEAKADVFESNLNLGLMLAKSGKVDAEQFLRTATKLKPTAHIDEGHARAWLSLARVIEATKPDEAVEAYREASKLQPRDPEPHLSAGALLEKQGHPGQAEAEYKQALEIDGQSSDALTGLVNLYMRGKRYPEAEQLLRKLALLRPDELTVRLQLGRVLAAAGKTSDAITELEAAAKVAPDDPGLKRDLADLYSEAGKFDLAEAQYRPLLSVTP